MITSVPFSGFYESLHSSEVDQAIEQMFGDDNGNPNEGLSAALQDLCNYQRVYVSYANSYVKALASEFKLSSLTFDELDSPREFNFTTDRIFASLSRDDVKRIYDATSSSALGQLAKQKFTSRSGFSSFYDADVSTWGEVETWDHNQLGVLLQAYVQEKTGDFDHYAEYNLMESAFGNGKLEHWISEATPGIDRLYKIYNYLQTRADRQYAPAQKAYI